jgi:hypothetical protein
MWSSQIRVSLQGLSQQILEELGDHPGLLGNPDEDRRRNDHAVLVCPAGKRFEAADAAALQVDQWLVERADRLLLDCYSQFRFQRSTLRDLILHRSLEHEVMVRTTRLCLIHGEVGTVGGGLEGLFALQPATVADTGADFDGETIDLDGAGDSLNEQAGETFLMPRRQTKRDDDEFVTAETIEAISVANCANPFGNFDRERVVAIVADKIIDLLETVEVHREDGDVAFPLFGFLVGLRFPGKHLSLKSVAIGELGQVIVVSVQSAFACALARRSISLRRSTMRRTE